MHVEIDGSDLVIRLPMNDKPTLSASQKTMVVATSHGNQPTQVEVQGKTLYVGVNAYIRIRN